MVVASPAAFEIEDALVEASLCSFDIAAAGSVTAPSGFGQGIDEGSVSMQGAEF